MENTIAKQVYNLKETPWYFGAYLNMARHNVYLISNEIDTKLNLNRPLENEDAILDSFIAKKEFLNKNNPRLILSNLVRFLPAVKVFSSDLLHKDIREKTDSEGADIAQMILFLKSSFKELKAFRDDYSHYYSKINQERRKETVDEDFAIMLSRQFDFAVSIARKRFEGVIPINSFEFVAKNIGSDLFSDETTITTRGLVFFCCLFLDKENAFHLFNKVSGFKDTRTFDFLATREVFTVFCVNLPHNKFVSENPQQALQLDMLNYLNRAPKELYNSLTEKGKNIFQPDLSDLVKKNNIAENSINETVKEFDYDEYIQAISAKKRSNDRFPEFALKYLDQSESFQFYFHLHLGKSITKSYQKSLLGQLPDENNRNIEIEIKTFGHLIDFKKSSNEDNEEVVNSIIQEKEFVKIFDETVQKVFSQYAPHFHVKVNKIGLLSKQNKKYSNQLYRPISPNAFLSIHELPKVALLEILSRGKASELITDFFERSKDAILNREFIEKVKSEVKFERLLKVFFDEKTLHLIFDENTEKTIEDIKIQLKKSIPENQKRNLSSKLKSLIYARYVNVVYNRKAKLNKVLEKHQLDASQIPGRIIDYWLNIESVKKEATIKNRIRAERKDCKQRMKDLVSGKAPKIGEMATFLARDIVKLVINADAKKRITSFYYDLLQECLALYADPDKKQLFLDLCGKELNLFDKNSGHPFLVTIDFGRIKKTKDLYQQYIELKGTKVRFNKDDNWISNTFYSKQKDEKTGKDKTLISIPDSKVPLSFVRFSREKTDFDFWLNSVKKGNEKNPNSKPIDLPTNLFDDALISLLKGKVKTDNVKKYNYSKLLALWVNETQPYYNEKREYTIYKEKSYQAIVQFDPVQKKPFKEYYTDELDKTFKKRKKEEKNIQKKDIVSVFKKAIEENEKVIRFHQTKDRITLMILKELVCKDLEITLNEISPDSEKSPLEKSISITETIKAKATEKIDGINTELSLEKTITDTRKRKDFSVFKKLVSDRRLYHLFQYYDSETIHYEELRKELSDYDRYKEQVFKAAFDLEKAIINVASDEEYSEIETEGIKHKGSNIQHHPYLNWLFKYDIINETEKEFLSDVRNRFSHNQYPNSRIVKNHLSGFENTNIAAQVVINYVEMVNNIISFKLKSE